MAGHLARTYSDRMGEMAAKADEAGRRAEDSRGLDHAVRFGLITYGVVHLTFAWLAAQLAFGDSSGEASGSGALQELAQQPLGEVVLWLIAAGMALMVFWRLLDAARGHRRDDGLTLWRKRATDVAMAVVYGVLAATAVSTVLGSSSGSSEQSSQTLTARVMELPAGQWLVGAIGLGILGVACGLFWRGLSEAFMDDLDADAQVGNEARAYRVLGIVGHVAKSVTIAIVGVLFIVSAGQHQPSESGSTDQALRELLQQPFGPYLLLAMAAGIASYGLFCFAQAKNLSR